MERYVGWLLIILLAGCSTTPSDNLPQDQSSPQPVLLHTPAPFNDGVEVAPKSDLVNPLDNSVLIFIPDGSFLMGADPEEGFIICKESRSGCTLDDFKDESPPHEVFLDEYWIYQTEVTNLQYRLCVEAGSCNPPQFIEYFANELFELHPVVYIRWYDAEDYCQWAGGRLPTEAEWEKAARGENAYLFPWGNEASCGYANLKGCSRGLTENVGSYPDGASPYGVLDMAGNASEWVADWYSPDYYAGLATDNPNGPESGEMKVARGGSWKNPFSGVRTTNRSANFAEIASSGVGFRCVMDLLPEAP